jgi:hypothetical protein
LTTILKRLRHRRSARSNKGNSVARVATDPRKLVRVSTEIFTKYSGAYLRHIVRHNNGVGRPPLVRRQQLAWAEANSQIRGLKRFANG